MAADYATATASDEGAAFTQKGAPRPPCMHKYGVLWLLTALYVSLLYSFVVVPCTLDRV